MTAKYYVFIITLIAIVCCESKTNEDFSEFVIMYVNSVYEQTEFYKQYTEAEDQEFIDINRKYMTKEFEITRWDSFAKGHLESIITFSNGTTGIVTMSIDDKENIEKAMLITR